MRTVPLLLLVVACVDAGDPGDALDPASEPEPEPSGEGATALVIDDGPRRAPPDPGPGVCAAAPIGDLASEHVYSGHGAASGFRHRAQLTWAVAETVGCVDHYVPTGGALTSYGWIGECTNVTTPRSGVPDAADGVLRLDRSIDPPTGVGRDRGMPSRGRRDDDLEWHRRLLAPSPGGLRRRPLRRRVRRRRRAPHLEVRAPMKPTIALLLLLAACVEPVDAPDPDDPVAPDGDEPTSGESTALVLDNGAERRPPGSGGGPCAVEPLGPFQGTAYMSDSGTGSGRSIGVTVTWSLVSTDGCVDRYDTTSGTAVGDDWGWQCDRVRYPDSGPVEPGDGVMLIDRSTMPVTFVMRGSTRYPVVEYCADDSHDPEPTYSIGGHWASYAGSFEGAASGGHVSTDGPNHTGRWTLQRAGVTFTPPPAGACSEPPSEAWSTDTRRYDDHDVSAELQWARVSTTGCVDTFAPSGLVRVPQRSYQGAACTTNALTAPVDGVGDTLRIDRSTSPPTFYISGRTLWQATTTCTRPDGTVFQSTGTVGGDWAGFSGVFHGNHFGGAHGRSRWEMRRL